MTVAVANPNPFRWREKESGRKVGNLKEHWIIINSDSLFSSSIESVRKSKPIFYKQKKKKNEEKKLIYKTMEFKVHIGMSVPRDDTACWI